MYLNADIYICICMHTQLTFVVVCVEITVNKMLHDGLVRDTQLDQAPSKRLLIEYRALFD